MEVVTVVGSFMAVVLGVISLTVMVLDTVNRQTLEKNLKDERKAFEEASGHLGKAHESIIAGLKQMEAMVETHELQIKSLTLGTQAPKRGSFL